MNEEVLLAVDVEFMPRWTQRPGDRYPKPVDEPPRRAEVRVVFCDGAYGYELRCGEEVRQDFYGGKMWRDPSTAVAFCENAAHARASREIGPVVRWVRRVEPSCVRKETDES